RVGSCGFVVNSRTLFGAAIRYKLSDYTMRLPRRKNIGAFDGCLLFLLAVGLALTCAPAAEAQTRTPAPDRIQLKAHAFDLADVRLLEGPFKRAMQLDADYLLRLNPDRLLSWFRKESG